MCSKAKHAARSRKTYRANRSAARAALTYFVVKNNVKAAMRGGSLIDAFKRRTNP